MDTNTSYDDMWREATATLIRESGTVASVLILSLVAIFLVGALVDVWRQRRAAATAHITHVMLVPVAPLIAQAIFVYDLRGS